MLLARLVPLLTLAAELVGATVTWVCTKKGAPAPPAVMVELAMLTGCAGLDVEATPLVLPREARIDPDVLECVVLVSVLLSEECAWFAGESSWPMPFLPERTGCAKPCCASASNKMPSVAPYSEPSPSNGASANIGLIQLVDLCNDRYRRASRAKLSLACAGPRPPGSALRELTLPMDEISPLTSSYHFLATSLGKAGFAQSSLRLLVRASSQILSPGRNMPLRAALGQIPATHCVVC